MARATPVTNTAQTFPRIRCNAPVLLRSAGLLRIKTFITLNRVIAGLSCADWKALYLDASTFVDGIPDFLETNWCGK